MKQKKHTETTTRHHSISHPLDIPTHAHTKNKQCILLVSLMKDSNCKRYTEHLMEDIFHGHFLKGVDVEGDAA